VREWAATIWHGAVFAGILDYLTKILANMTQANLPGALHS
jgi:hypothetical protein